MSLSTSQGKVWYYLARKSLTYLSFPTFYTLLLFSCSHAGILNVVKDAIKTFARPIYMVLFLSIFSGYKGVAVHIFTYYYFCS